MKTMKRFYFLAMMLAAGIMTLTLTACGDDDDKNKEDGYGGDTNYGGVNIVPCSSCNGTGNCPICDGVGSETCSICNGNGVYNGYGGTYTCWMCDGKGRTQCFLCYGSGKCTKCNGTGYVEDTSGGYDDDDWDDDGGSSGSSQELCHYCKGEKDCRNYVNTSHDKYYCHGSGECQWCGGDGWTRGFGLDVPCANCNTPGKVGKNNSADKPGDGYCSYCGGSGRCGKCGGTGYK